MSLRITIAFIADAQSKAAGSDLVHRFRNFGEALYREFRLSGHAKISIDEIDSATDRIELFVNTKRHIGGVSAFIKKALKQHNLEELVTVTRG